MKISIVIPVFREEQNIGEFYERINNVTSKVDKYNWSFIFVNDGSLDNSLIELKKIIENDKRVLVLDLSRNFGKEIALTAGVHEAEDIGSDAVICIDADLQHPPELIPKLIDEWRNGAEVVVTIRTQIDKQPLLRRLGSHGYYWIMSKISRLPVVSQTTDFSLFDKKVIAAFRHATERNRMFRGIMDWMGFRRTYVEFKADARTKGDVGYSYSKLWNLAISSITSFSLWPLRITGYLGLLITSISGLMLLWMMINYVLRSDLYYTPLAIVVMTNTFLMGIILISIGLVASYIGTIHTEVINRPLYIVRERFKSNSESLPKIAGSSDQE